MSLGFSMLLFSVFFSLIFWSRALGFSKVIFGGSKLFFFFFRGHLVFFGPYFKGFLGIIFLVFLGLLSKSKYLVQDHTNN